MPETEQHRIDWACGHCSWLAESTCPTCEAMNDADSTLAQAAIRLLSGDPPLEIYHDLVAYRERRDARARHNDLALRNLFDFPVL
jgi:hypothetical protein